MIFNDFKDFLDSMCGSSHRPSQPTVSVVIVSTGAGLRWAPVDENGYPITGYLLRYAHEEDMAEATEAVPRVVTWHWRGEEALITYKIYIYNIINVQYMFVCLCGSVFVCL